MYAIIQCRIILSQCCIILSLSLFIDITPNSCICILLTSYGSVTFVYSLQYIHIQASSTRRRLRIMIKHCCTACMNPWVKQQCVIKDRFDHDHKQRKMFISENVLTPNKTGKGSCSTLYLPHTPYLADFCLLPVTTI